MINIVELLKFMVVWLLVLIGFVTAVVVGVMLLKLHPLFGLAVILLIATFVVAYAIYDD